MEDTQLDEIKKKGLSAIDESFEIMRMVINMVKDIHPSVLYDIQKYHPQEMKKMQEDRHAKISSTLTENMQKGIKEGVYREDIQPDIVASLYVASVESIIEKMSNHDSVHDFATLYRELFRMHIRGIASEKGIAYLVEKMKTENT